MCSETDAQPPQPTKTLCMYFFSPVDKASERHILSLGWGRTPFTVAEPYRHVK